MVENIEIRKDIPWRGSLPLALFPAFPSQEAKLLTKSHLDLPEVTPCTPRIIVFCRLICPSLFWGKWLHVYPSVSFFAVIDCIMSYGTDVPSFLRSSHPQLLTVAAVNILYVSWCDFCLEDKLLEVELLDQKVCGFYLNTDKLTNFFEPNLYF